MKADLQSKGGTQSGVFWLLVLTTISGLVTTYSSREVIEVFRVIAGAIVVFAVIRVFRKVRVSQSLMVALGLYLVAFFYAVAVAGLTNGLEVTGPNLLLDFAITGCAIVLFAAQFHLSGYVFPARFIVWFSIYGVSGILLTYLLGGLTLDLPPQFVFEVGSDQIGREETYSLMLTGFFSIAAIFATVGMLRSGFGYRGLRYGLLTLLFLALAVLAGGRGELIAGLFVILLALLDDRRLRKPALLLFFVLAGSLVLFGSMPMVDDFGVLERFRSLFEGDYSYRDVLLGQVVDLLINEPRCFLIGCGPSYFQVYYSYDFGLYPHNHFAEAVVIFGFPLVSIAVGLATRGAFLYYRKTREFDLFLLFFIYSLIVGLKTGYFLGNWILNAGMLFFIGLCFERELHALKHGRLSSLVCKHESVS